MTTPLFYYQDRICIVLDRLDALRGAVVIRYLDNLLRPVGKAQIAGVARLRPAGAGDQNGGSDVE